MLNYRAIGLSIYMWCVCVCDGQVIVNHTFITWNNNLLISILPLVGRNVNITACELTGLWLLICSLIQSKTIWSGPIAQYDILSLENITAAVATLTIVYRNFCVCVCGCTYHKKSYIINLKCTRIVVRIYFSLSLHF